jgi:hypothetical protein
LTPRSVVLTEVGQCEEAARALGLPVFVKGAVQSRKARGWRACVANTPEDLRQLTDSLLSLPERSRGRVVVRELARLRHHRTSGTGFPLGREYRVFLHDRQILGLGYYWEGEDDLRDCPSRSGTPFAPWPLRRRGACRSRMLGWISGSGRTAGGSSLKRAIRSFPG